MESPTFVMRRQLHTDRWSSWGDHTGIVDISSVMYPSELRRYPIFDGLDDDFLKDISADVSIATWRAGAILFEEGTYVDLAFWIDSGEVELYLASDAESGKPIFPTRIMSSIPTTDTLAGNVVSPLAQRNVAQNAPITFLASADFDLPRGGRMRLAAGDIFGEIGALNGWPQSVTARTASACRLVQIRLPALRKLRRKARKLRERLDELYRVRTLRQHLSTTPLLRGCDASIIEKLCERVELVSLQPGDEVTAEGKLAEHVILVRSGFLKLTQAVGAGEMAVSYLSKGSLLGEVELLLPELGRKWQTTTRSVGYSELVRIRYNDLSAVFGQQPELQKYVWESAVDRIREIGFTRHHPHRSDLVDFALAKGLVQGNSILVIDLETCTRCDDCVRGCASTHGGIPRFVREGEKYSGFLITRACYHCADPVCLIGCPTGAIRRANVGNVVEIDPSICIGCGACAENCPYDAIIMHELGETWPSNALPEHLRGQERRVATKCDLCYASPAGPACVSSCPHGCAHRVGTADEFDALLRAKALAQGLDQERETLSRKR